MINIEKYKQRIITLTYQQMLEVSHDLNEWKWNNLLGDKPDNWDNMRCWKIGKWYQRLFNRSVTKHDYVHPIRKFIGKFVSEKDELHYHNVIVNKSMTEEEFEKFWIVHFT